MTVIQCGAKSLSNICVIEQLLASFTATSFILWGCEEFVLNTFDAKKDPYLCFLQLYSSCETFEENTVDHTEKYRVKVSVILHCAIIAETVHIKLW